MGRLARAVDWLRAELAADMDAAAQKSGRDVVRDAVETLLAFGLLARVALHTLVFVFLTDGADPDVEYRLTAGPQVAWLDEPLTTAQDLELRFYSTGIATYLVLGWHVGGEGFVAGASPALVGLVAANVAVVLGEPVWAVAHYAAQVRESGSSPGAARMARGDTNGDP
jgi:hypothetical protein